MQGPIEVKFDRGVFLPEADVWLDPWEAKERAFISHAHTDHVAPHRLAWCSVLTGGLLQRRSVAAGTIAGQPYGKPFPLDERGEFEAELWPAGHVLGSAQILVRRRRDAATLLYTGDFKLRPGEAAEEIQVRKAGTLVMETTFGRPQYVHPPAEEVLANLLRFVREALEEGQVPMLGAYALGKTQELLVALGRRAPELRFLLHRSAVAITRFYQEQGYPLPPWEVLDAEPAWAGQVVIVPPSVLRSQQLRNVRSRVTAVVTGWALDRSAAFRYQVDGAFPLSDHADYPSLLRFVERVAPERVLTLHGFADEFARDLRARGLEAWSLTGANQLELFREDAEDGGSEAAPEPAGMGWKASGAGSFAGFVRTCEAIAATAGRTGKVEQLAAFFRELEGDALVDAATYLTGRPFDRTAAVRSAQVGWAVCKRALLEAAGRSEVDYRKIAAGQNDAGRIARLMLDGRTTDQGVSWVELRDFFRETAEARGPLGKVALLSGRLRRMSPAEGACVIKILAGDLRLGLKEGLVEEALAQAFGQPGDAVRKAHLLTGSLGRTADLARAGKLQTASVTPFVPLSCMLASPQETAAGIWQRLGQEENRVWLEDKFDGVRAQLHRAGSRVEIYSRDLRSLTAEFGELAEAASALGNDVILDGEIIASGVEKRLSFFDLQKRLGRRREADLFQGAAVPVRYLAFDLLWCDGESFLDRPLRERREVLGRLDLPCAFERVAHTWADSPSAVEAAFKAARARGNEGLMAKDPASAYLPGRRGLAWLKFKQPLATLDCVVVAVEQGHGKRSHVLSDYTFAVRDEASGRLVVIGKAYSGLTDAEIEELTAEFQASTVTQTRRVRWVEPRVVLEIAFASVQASDRHESGLALRFPRIKAIRRDKTVAEIDTLEMAKRLAERTGEKR